MSRLNCDLNDLCAELCRWHNGTKGMRFGQQVLVMYGRRPGLTWPELFYEKDDRKAFEIAYREIEGGQT